MTDRRDIKLSRRSFYSLIILSYLVIAIVAIFMGLYHVGVTTILSFLGITVSPSAPAFLAIFLSQYSEQAKAFRKSEKLADIQISKEISLARTEHYKSVKEKLQSIDSIIISQNVTFSNQISDFRSQSLGTKLTETGEYKTAFLHISGTPHPDGENIVGEFLKSEEKCPELSKKIDALKTGVHQLVSQIAQSNPDIQISDHTNNLGYGAVIGTSSTIGAVLDIWGDGRDKTQNVIKWIESFSNGATPDKSISKLDLTLESTSIEYLNITLARTEGFSFGIQVLNIIREILEHEDLQAKLEELAFAKRQIEDKRNALQTKIEKLIDEIEKNRYSVVLSCCPYREYEGEIY